MVSMDTFSNADSILPLPNKDKLLHGVFYFGFTVLWTLFFRTWPAVKKPILFGFIFAVVYGIIIEICQAFFTTNRSGDVLDALANTTGAALAVIVLSTIFNRKS
jgi:VanZ family protein